MYLYKIHQKRFLLYFAKKGSKQTWEKPWCCGVYLWSRLCWAHEDPRTVAQSPQPEPGRTGRGPAVRAPQRPGLLTGPHPLRKQRCNLPLFLSNGISRTQSREGELCRHLPSEIWAEGKTSVGFPVSFGQSTRSWRKEKSAEHLGPEEKISCRNLWAALLLLTVQRSLWGSRERNI